MGWDPNKDTPWWKETTRQTQLRYAVGTKSDSCPQFTVALDKYMCNINSRLVFDARSLSAKSDEADHLSVRELNNNAVFNSIHFYYGLFSDNCQNVH